MFTSDIFTGVFGDVSLANVIASFLLVFLGATINFLIELSQRDPASNRTPSHFSFKFLIADNGARILISFFFCIVAVICGPALVEYLIFIHIPEQLSRFSMILLGWGSDYLPMKIKQRFFKQENTDTK